MEASNSEMAARWKGAKECIAKMIKDIATYAPDIHATGCPSWLKVPHP